MRFPTKRAVGQSLATRFALVKSLFSSEPTTEQPTTSTASGIIDARVKYFQFVVTPDRACSQRSPLGARARAYPTRRPCPPVAFFFPVFLFAPLTYDTRPLAFRIPRLSAWRFPNSPKGNITATHPPSVFIKNARATALIRVHCAISFALCSNELFLHRLEVTFERHARLRIVAPQNNRWLLFRR